ncbi:hypothetical protein ACJX0J_027082, partial [Zea mays]
PEVGSSGRKSTAHRAVSGAPPAALENPEDRIPSTPGRTHNRIRSPRIQASNRRLCSPPAPTHVRAFAPQGPVPLAQPARSTRRGGPPRSSLPNGRRAESFADDLKRDGALLNSPKSWEG